MNRWLMRLEVAVFAVIAALMMVAPVLAQEGDAPSPALKDLSDFALWSLLLGPITSVVTAIINQRHWQSSTKLASFVLFSLIAAAGNALFNGDLDFHDTARAFLVIGAGGLAFYEAAKAGIKTIEAKTSASGSGQSGP